MSIENYLGQFSRCAKHGNCETLVNTATVDRRALGSGAAA